MVNYDMSWMSTNSTLYEIFYHVNDVAGGFLGIILVVVLWVALFSGFKSYETVTATIITSFITSVVAGLLWFAGLLAWYVTLIPLILLVTGIIINFFKT